MIQAVGLAAPAVPERDWTLRRRIGISFAALAGLLVVLVALLVLSALQFASADNAVIYRWQPAVNADHALLTDLVDQETGLRGFALSSDEKFLQPYQQARAAQHGDQRRLRALVDGDARLRGGLAALGRAAAQWQQRSVVPAIASVRGGESSAARLAGGRQEKRRFDLVRARSATLSEALLARAGTARSSHATNGIVFVVALSLTVLLLLLAGIALWRGLHRWILAPADDLRAQTRRVSDGAHYRQIVPAGPLELVELGRDVETMRLQLATQLARAEQAKDELRERSEELARSNDDLAQFAYVASHDLSEPLRKVANFCQLLERQYGPKLDARALQYIEFAVDGAKRMQALITDLLALSRVGRSSESFTVVHLDAALEQAIANLGDRFTGPQARIERETPLPAVAGDRSLLISLLENLVGNAVKYRRAGVAPVVRIGAQRDPAPGSWLFTVADNGIGIDPQYAERIFAVFQRLHLRDEYGGTGIGLALCRKIVEFHDGQIWLDPVQSAHGATFRFTLAEGDPLAEPRD